MNRIALLTLAPLAVVLAGCQGSQEAPEAEETPTAEPTPEVLGTATLKTSDGKDAGTAELAANGDEVRISIALSGLPEGTHAVHLHTTGTCEAPDFTSAGGHLNPGMKEHGTQNPKGSHLGDLPNAVVDAEGNSSVSTALHGTRDEVLTAIFDEDGTAVVVHADEDDNVSDPAGNAGSRIACGVLSQG